MPRRSSYPGMEILLFRSLRVGKGDRVLVAFDPARAGVAALFGDALARAGVAHSMLEADYDGADLPHSLRDGLLGDEHNVVLLFFRKSIWHQPARREAKYQLGKRLAAFSGTPEMLASGPAVADPDRMKRLCDDLKKKTDVARQVIMRGKKGTLIKAEIDSVRYEYGLYWRPASGGNFPAGEISFGPVEGTANGFLRSDVKVKGLGLSATGNDATFHVRDGAIELAERDGVFPHRFQELIEGKEELRFVAEVSFGINPERALYADPDALPEEKILGTAHVGLGSNISFGGTRTGWHLDAVFELEYLLVNQYMVFYGGLFNRSLLSDATIKWLKPYGVLSPP